MMQASQLQSKHGKNSPSGQFKMGSIHGIGGVNPLITPQPVKSMPMTNEVNFDKLESSVEDLHD